MKKIIDAHPYITSAIVAVVLTGVSFLVAVLAGWITELNPLELFAVATSFACTYLCVVQKRFNYVLGTISCAAYAVLFFQFGLLASAVLNLYLVGTLVYGWFRWRPDVIARRVEHVRPVRLVLIYLPVSLAIFGLAFIVVSLLGGNLPVLDSIILAATILAQLLLDNKKLETWIVWTLVNVVAIYVYFTSGLYLATIQYVFFLLNAVYGYYSWWQSMPHRQLRKYAGRDVKLTLALFRGSQGVVG